MSRPICPYMRSSDICLCAGSLAFGVFHPYMGPARPAAIASRRSQPHNNAWTRDETRFTRRKRRTTNMQETTYARLVSAMLSIGSSVLMAQPPVTTPPGGVACSGEQCGTVERGLRAFIDREVDGLHGNGRACG